MILFQHDSGVFRRFTMRKAIHSDERPGLRSSGAAGTIHIPGTFGGRPDTHPDWSVQEIDLATKRRKKAQKTVHLVMIADQSVTLVLCASSCTSRWFSLTLRERAGVGTDLPGSPVTRIAGSP
jgi:hypothetical protein